jgi:hypothetical protein
VRINGIRFTWAELRQIYSICSRAISREGWLRPRLNFAETAAVQGIADVAAHRQIRQEGR